MSNNSKQRENLIADAIKKIDEIIGNDEKPIRLLVTIPKIASSGMSRRMNFYYVDRERKVRCLNYYFSILLDVPNNRDGLLIRGCGMDMVFATLYDLNLIIFSFKNNGTLPTNNDKEQYYFDANKYILLD